MKGIEFITCDSSGIDKIKELWEGLNNHHLERSPYFQDHYASFTFEKRKNNLFNKTGKGEMFIELALDHRDKKPVGYCLSIVIRNPDPEGEVESLFIDPSFRGKGIGEIFMQHAIKWLDSKKVVHKRIVVASGNEEVFPFYNKFRFFPRFTTLEQKKT